jgi:DNA polymerase
VDLLKAGPWKDAADPQTEELMVSVKVNSDPAKLWAPGWVAEAISSAGFPREKILSDRELQGLIERADEYHAHNMEFERAVWRYRMQHHRGFPPLELSKCRCTAAQAATMALPRKLEKVAEVLGLQQKKDTKGHALMLKMCKPRKPRKAEREENPNWENMVFWHETAEQLRDLAYYCLQDAEAEYEVSQVCRPLIPIEQKVWEHDQIINQRGAPVDAEFVTRVIEVLGKYEAQLLSELQELNGGAFRSTRQREKLLKWLNSYNIFPENTQKQTLIDLLERDDLPKTVRKVLEITQKLAKASTAKFRSLIARMQDDHRARGLIMFHGAGTGRFAGKAFQPHNLPRDSYKGQMFETALELFMSENVELITILLDDPYFVASRCLRGSIAALPGNELVCADYSSVEARGVAWMAEDENLLKAFREGLDVYKLAAMDIFGVGYEEVTDEQRQVGKVCILALGYGGGIAAYATMAVGYSIDLESLVPIVYDSVQGEEYDKASRMAKIYLSDNEAMSLEAAICCDAIKQRWRSGNHKTVALWRLLEDAAFAAIKNPGQIFDVGGKVQLTVWWDPAGNKYLCIRLPSGRVLYYFGVFVKEKVPVWERHKPKAEQKTKASIFYWTVDGVTKQWRVTDTYGGKLLENIVQAICRDLLVFGMLKVEKAGYPVVMHVHDESMSEVKKGFGSLEEYCELLASLPPWAKGFPLKAAGWVGPRFRK